MYDKLLKNPMKFLAESSDRHLGLRAPPDPVVLGRLMQAVAQALTGGSRMSMCFLVAMDILPTCQLDEDILDLWRHPLSDQKLRPFRSDCTFWGQPLQGVTLGDRSPQDVTRTLVAVRFSETMHRSPPCAQQVGWPLFESMDMQTFLVDVPAVFELEARRQLDPLVAERAAAPGDTSRSRGSSQDYPRSTLTLELLGGQLPAL